MLPRTLLRARGSPSQASSPIQGLIVALNDPSGHSSHPATCAPSKDTVEEMWTPRE